ncbi:C-X-C motif chemokine 13 [Hemicordylus capensis]|uniref:C-X-C motif chemokine 13 n=1 Tax=Hemicordylus capensis TaxID=884348 RepID=UPI002302586E|nr:C-X-C motif chemokine 13 [Hemicordylus capensis]
MSFIKKEINSSLLASRNPGRQVSEAKLPLDNLVLLRTEARMGPRHLLPLFALLVACHISVATILTVSESHIGCQCRKETSSFIPSERHKSVMIIPAGISCSKMEIIITLKKADKRVCIKPNTRWLQDMIKRLQSINTPSSF